MNRQVIRSVLSAALVLASFSNFILPAQQAAAQEQTPPQAPSAENAPETPAQPAGVLAEGNVAYVYKTDLATANDYKSFLETNGYTVVLVPVTNSLSTNFQPFDFTLIGADTGALSEWGTAAGQAEYIAKNSQVMGIGEGGYAFFGKLSMKIGHPNGAHGNYRAVKGDALSDVFNIPNNLSAVATILPIYTTNLNTVGIYLSPTVPSGTEVLATLAPHQLPLYAPLIAEGCHQLWGFSGRPSGMNPNGKRLFLNALHKLQGQCQNTLQTCAIVKSQTAIPAPGIINFDNVASSTLISNSYKALYGVTFATQIRAGSSATAHSLPNVAVNPPGSVAAQPPFTVAFDVPKTHVGFYMGGTSTAPSTGTLIAYDANDTEICRTTRPSADGHTAFIGLYDKQQRISKIVFDASIAGLETMDDLTFAPHRFPNLSFRFPERPGFNPLDDITTEILKSDNKVFNAKFNLPGMQLWEMLAGDGSVKVQASTPGIDIFGNPDGMPDVPILRRVIAVPEGASLKIVGIDVEQDEAINVPLMPSQPSAVDALRNQMNQPFDDPPETFKDKPYVISPTFYALNTLYPAEPVSATNLGKMRDLNLWQLEMAAGQYNPKTGLLSRFKAISIELEFDGGNGGFLPKPELADPFEHHFDGIYAQALNQAVLSQYPFELELIPNICIGAEYLIVTHPDYKVAADALKVWKAAKGISTIVRQTGAGVGEAGTTKEQIQAFIRSFNSCVIRPSYLLLFGDTEDIPVWDSGADLQYSLKNNTDNLPDLAYGRIPVDTLVEANRVVNKIIAFEKTPPVNAAFYSNFSIASYFECCRNAPSAVGTDARSFLETSELVRNALQAKGKTVQRIYNTSTAYEDYTGGSTTPNRYYNGSLLPVDLRASSGYAWNGNSTNIVNAINEGRMLMFHRDHGGTSGWADPSFSTANLPSLTNGALTPVFYSVNCSSGRIDSEPGNGWAEAILRLEGGAVGVIGDTRNSPTWENSALSRGLFDATWTNVLPSYGGSTKIRRLGDILNYAKLYLVSQIGVAQTAGSISESDAMFDVRIYNVYGDPTMELWTSNPHGFILPTNVFTTVVANGLQLTYPVSLTEITALQNGLPVGRGITDISGTLKIEYFVMPKPGQPVQLSASTVNTSDGDAISVPLGEVEVKSYAYLPSVVKP